jgi:hypothetical protein
MTDTHTQAPDSSDQVPCPTTVYVLVTHLAAVDVPAGTYETLADAAVDSEFHEWFSGGNTFSVVEFNDW